MSRTKKTPITTLHTVVCELNIRLGVSRSQQGILPSANYARSLIRVEANLHELGHHLVLARREGKFTHGLPVVDKARTATAQITGLTDVSKDLNELEAHAFSYGLMKEYGWTLPIRHLLRESAWVGRRPTRNQLLVLYRDPIIMEIVHAVRHHLDEEIARAESEARR